MYVCTTEFLTDSAIVIQQSITSLHSDVFIDFPMSTIDVHVPPYSATLFHRVAARPHAVTVGRRRCARPVRCALSSRHFQLARRSTAGIVERDC